MVYYRNKQLARALNGVESGDEISANIGGDTYRGVVTTVFEDEVLEDNTPVELEVDAIEEGCINIAVEYVGDDEVVEDQASTIESEAVGSDEPFGISNSDDDYVVYAVVEGQASTIESEAVGSDEVVGEGGDEETVNAVINWEDEASAPDITIKTTNLRNSNPSLRPQSVTSSEDLLNCKRCERPTAGFSKVN